MDGCRWLGLIIGTRLWFPFFSTAVDTDEKFEKQLDALTREIGGRGMPRRTSAAALGGLSEAIPPAPAPAPAPARASALAPAPVPAPTTPRSDFTPSMQQSPVPSAAGVSLAELSGLLEMIQQQADRTDAKMEQQRQEMQQQLRDAKPQSASDAISEEQLDALQARLQRLHAESELLTEEELGSLEDTIADCIEVLETGDVRDHAVDQTLRMVLLSERMKADGSLARQLKRKFV